MFEFIYIYGKAIIKRIEFDDLQISTNSQKKQWINN